MAKTGTVGSSPLEALRPRTEKIAWPRDEMGGAAARESSPCAAVFPSRHSAQREDFMSVRLRLKSVWIVHRMVTFRRIFSLSLFEFRLYRWTHGLQSPLSEHSRR